MTAREVVGHIREAGEMVEAKELVINVIGVISGDANHLSVPRQNKLDRGVCMSHSQKKQMHLPNKQKTCRKQGKP